MWEMCGNNVWNLKVIQGHCKDIVARHVGTDWVGPKLPLTLKS